MPPFSSPSWSRLILASLVCIIGLLLAFGIGVKVGERREAHYANWNRHYSDMFHAVHEPTTPFAHGVFGTVLSNTDAGLVIQGRDQHEQTVVLTSSTAIRADQGIVTVKDLAPNTQVGVFGEANAQGQIEARLIRLFSHQ